MELIPVDSEHSAIFSLLENMDSSEVERIILTASGGSLRDRSADDLGSVTPGEALNHPTRSMGSKITIDSATLMNKGLEVIEAHHLFDAPYGSIDVLIHPESVIHSMVETIDGSMYALLGVPDMALPILNALSYPERRRNPFGRLRLEELGSLNFRSPDASRYPALALCYDAGRAGGTTPAVLNAQTKRPSASSSSTESGSRHRAPGRRGAGASPAVRNGIEDIFLADAWARSRTYYFAR